MKSLNLINIFTVCDEYKGDLDLINKYLSHSSQYSSSFKKMEVDSFVQLCNFLDVNISDYSIFEGFHINYTIPQISKEFDVLRISEKLAINIELKTTMTEKAEEQLKQNKYYLSNINLPKRIFLFVSDEKILYEYVDEKMIEVNKDTLLAILLVDQSKYIQDLDSVFQVSKFLVSPLNSTEIFLNREYFLTDGQMLVKKSIMNSISKLVKYMAIDAKAGTGKTLLLYDIAIDLTDRGFKVLLIHCAQLCNGHKLINDKVENLKIISAKGARSFAGFDYYDFILLDEAHRYYRFQLNQLVIKTKELKSQLIFCLDDEQRLGKSEIDYHNSILIKELSGEDVYALNGKIRTNKEIAGFIVSLYDLSKSGNSYDYSSIQILFAKDVSKGKQLIQEYMNKEYQYISLTPSVTNFSQLDYLDFGLTSHEAIGQEFDKVVTFINQYFYYDDNLLLYRTGPNPDHMLTKLLFQNLTRVREKLCIVVIANKPLFKTIVNVILNYK
ncbi:MAG: DUF2075 domain-containing protein [Tenericutes bacterium]|nr:DUF2075 domain-containing protein [Mycoplasmatota bacterium]